MTHAIAPAPVRAFAATMLATLCAVCGCARVSLPALGLTGSSSSNATERARQAGRLTFVLGPLADPERSTPGWPGIGANLTAELERQLGKSHGVTARTDAHLADEVEQALARGERGAAKALKHIADRHPDVGYVIFGRVIDFSHIVRKPQDLSAWGPSRNRRDAVVTIELTAVNLRSREIAIGAQRVSASAWVSDSSPTQPYRGLSFNSHRFSRTPLGLAGHDVIDRAATCLASLAPARDEAPIRIVNLIEGRRVRLSSNAFQQTQPGDVLFACVYDANGLTLKPVLDPHTRKPLTARIESRGLYPSAWLQGQWPSGTKLPNAVLLRQLPAQSSAIASAHRR